MKIAISTIAKNESGNVRDFIASCKGADLISTSDDKYIAVAHLNSPFFTLLYNNDGAVSLKTTYTLPHAGYATAFTSDDKYIAVGHAGTPHFTLLYHNNGAVSLKTTYTLPSTGYATAFSNK